MGWWPARSPSPRPTSWSSTSSRRTKPARSWRPSEVDPRPASGRRGYQRVRGVPDAAQCPPRRPLRLSPRRSVHRLGGPDSRRAALCHCPAGSAQCATILQRVEQPAFPAVSPADQPRCVRGAPRDKFSSPIQAGQGPTIRGARTAGPSRLGADRSRIGPALPARTRRSSPAGRADSQPSAAPFPRPQVSSHAALLVAAEGCDREPSRPVGGRAAKRPWSAAWREPGSRRWKTSWRGRWPGSGSSAAASVMPCPTTTTPATCGSLLRRCATGCRWSPTTAYYATYQARTSGRSWRAAPDRAVRLPLPGPRDRVRGRMRATVASWLAAMRQRAATMAG